MGDEPPGDAGQERQSARSALNDAFTRVVRTEEDDIPALINDAFRRNGARAWLLRFVVLCVIAIVAVAALSMQAPPELVQSLVDAPPLNRVLNVLIALAFVVGLVLVYSWLMRGWREESLVNRFVKANGMVAAGTARRTLGNWSLDGIGRSAIRDRAELLQELARTGTSYEAAATADALADREEPRVQIARYTASALVLLGLLGTFVGLLITIQGVTSIVDGLVVDPGDDLEAFLIPLQAGLRAPLEGMAVAFSTSLFGLAGSLVLGAGALVLSAAQASWIGKLEQATSLYLAPNSGAAPVAAGLPSPAAATGGAEFGRLEASARFLRDAQAATDAHIGRLDATSTRMTATLGDFRDRVADLAAQFERVEALLARVADGQGAGRQSVNDISMKLADLASVAASVKSDVRDGLELGNAELNGAARSLREGIEGGLAAVAAGVARDTEAGERNEMNRLLLEELRGIRAALARTTPGGPSAQ